MLIPQGATPLRAQLVFKPDDRKLQSDHTGRRVTIQGEVIADAAAFTAERFAPSALRKMPSVVLGLAEAWVIVDREMSESAPRNAAPILEAMVGQRSWSTGHAPAPYLSGVLSGVGLRKVRSLDHATAGAPRLRSLGATPMTSASAFRRCCALACVRAMTG